MEDTIKGLSCKKTNISRIELTDHCNKCFSVTLLCIFSVCVLQAHYDLAISVALWWLDKDGGQDVLDGDSFGAAGSAQYPNRLERKAMILSSFAGIIMCTIVYPFTLSYHPFAMLGSYKAVYHSKKHSQKLKRWLSEREKASAPPGQVSVHSSSSSSSSSSHSFLSDNSDRREDRAEHYEGSLESLHD
ncbi:uncharacterized protein C2orf80 homolog isoform X3 [Etheostoma spectabile]|uniref:uncharacterized protein C2orf80 homolog isoform X3 n=1 Tax=Etheostoma spectabile TaxID=54343 RepID=UPI0013AEC152|nr:uncharacterized protein C2orf80 homolog isoform X3 [Etheostoma spectabile]